MKSLCVIRIHYLCRMLFSDPRNERSHAITNQSRAGTLHTRRHFHCVIIPALIKPVIIDAAHTSMIHDNAYSVTFCFYILLDNILSWCGKGRISRWPIPASANDALCALRQTSCDSVIFLTWDDRRQWDANSRSSTTSTKFFRNLFFISVKNLSLDFYQRYKKEEY